MKLIEMNHGLLIVVRHIVSIQRYFREGSTEAHGVAIILSNGEQHDKTFRFEEQREKFLAELELELSK